MKHVVHGWLVI